MTDPQGITADRREQLGRIAHEAWAVWLKEQPSPWPVETVAWDDRHPDARESYRRIGEAVAAAERERCAKLIEASVCEPGEQCPDRFCPDCIRYRQAQADADLLREGGEGGGT